MQRSPNTRRFRLARMYAYTHSREYLSCFQIHLKHNGRRRIAAGNFSMFVSENSVECSEPYSNMRGGSDHSNEFQHRLKKLCPMMRCLYSADEQLLLPSPTKSYIKPGPTSANLTLKHA